MSFARRRFQKTFQKQKKLTGRTHPSGLKTKTEHWRPRAAVVAGGDPRRGRGVGGYQRVHRVLPHLWVVELSVSDHHVDGGPNSGGRWFGRGWFCPNRAARFKLGRGLEVWVH